MKKLLSISLLFICYSFHCLAQDQDIMRFRGTTTGIDKDTITGNGFYRVMYPGVHASSLLNYNTPFSSTGTFQLEALYTGELLFRNKTDNTTWTAWKKIFHSVNFNPNDYLDKKTNIWQTDLDNNPRLYFEKLNGTGSGTTYFQGHGQNPFEFRNAGGQALVKIRTDGNIGIGVAARDNYRLTVGGAIQARKVKVTQETWADHVFEPHYELPAIYELEQFIQKHKHLPGIPSAKEVLAEGIDLGEMNKKLLQKVEELTLYVIELKKENERQQQQLDKLDKK